MIVRAREVKPSLRPVMARARCAGTLQSMGRETAAEKIRELGGTFQTAVAKDTTYLVAGGKVGASKLKKAEQYGTKIIDEQTLLELIQ